jgi:Tfp pilus assembly ATPase PilU
MRYQQAPDVVHDVVEDRAVLVDPDGQELITLNRTGSLLWAALDGTRDESGLADLLAEHHPEIPREQLESDVATFLQQLVSERLVERG